MSPDLAPFFERRQRFTAAIGDALAVIPGGIESLRNGDVHYEFRQARDFFFLTGCDEPDAVAVINPAHAKERFVLFVRPRDREMEIWNGRRAGTEGAIATYGADAAYTIDQLDAKLREYAVERAVLYYRLGNHAFDARITRLVAELRGARSRGFPAPVRIEDPGPLLHDLRLRKTPAEITRLSRACAISRDAHAEAMRYARPGMHEYEVQAALEYVFRVNGSSRNAYPSIVASGPNACILHYVENTRRMADGDLLLIDAGCEYGYMAADITRTFPVNGRFSGPQRAIYEIVLRAQLAGIEAAKSGVKYEAVHHYREFYMHGTGHWLGMDVHDVGDYRMHGASRALEPGMVFTVEPGLYVDPERESVTYSLREYSEEEQWERRYRLGIAAAKKLEEDEKAKASKITHPVPKEFRGIGVRIEDDVLITAAGREILTAGTPKTVDEVERACAETSRLARP